MSINFSKVLHGAGILRQLNKCVKMCTSSVFLLFCPRFVLYTLLFLIFLWLGCWRYFSVDENWLFWIISGCTPEVGMRINIFMSVIATSQLKERTSATVQYIRNFFKKCCFATAYHISVMLIFVSRLQCEKKMLFHNCISTPQSMVEVRI
jgi:hypothetical protein